MSDRVIHAMTTDLSFRIVCATTSHTVNDLTQSQRSFGPPAKLLGELSTGAILIRQAMAPGLRVQAILQGKDAKGTLVADAHPHGMTRGLSRLGKAVSPLILGPGALLQVMRTLPNGSIHQGVVEVSEGGSISDALMQYMADSEQVVSMISVLTLLDPAQGERTRVSAGYLVQPLPEVERGSLEVMIEHLSGLESLDKLLQHPDLTADKLLSAIVREMPIKVLDEQALSFGCLCSEERVLSSLLSVGQDEIEDMIREGKPIEVSCDYCNKDYIIAPDTLKALLFVAKA